MKDKSQTCITKCVSNARLLAVCAMLIFLISAIFAFSLVSPAKADEISGSATVDIVSYNLNYSDRVNIAYAVDVNGASESDVEMLFWYSEPTAVTDAPDYKDTTHSVATRSDGSVRYSCVFYSDGIAPKNSSKQIYAAAHIKGTDIYSSIERYSILEYLYERQSTPGISEYQSNFYASYLRYANDIQLLLNHNTDALPSDYSYLRINGGSFSDGYARGIYKIGGTVTLVASTTDQAVSWYDEAGDYVGSGYELEITVTAGHNVYTAMTDITVTAVGGTVEVIGGVPSVGATAVLTAPVSRNSYDEVSGANITEYFIGWYTSSGSLVSAAARAAVTITGAEVYEARYALPSGLDNYAFNDFSNGMGSTTLTPSGNEVDSASAEGGIVHYASYREGNVSATSLVTKYSNLSVSYVKRVSFDINLPSRDVDYDEKENELVGDFFTSSSDKALYVITIATASKNLIELAIVPITEDGTTVIGYNLALASDLTVMLLPEALPLSAVKNITLEIVANEDGTIPVVCNLYIDGAYAVSVTAFSTNSSGNVSYTPDGTLTFSFGTQCYTKGYVYLDNFLFYEINVTDDQ